MSRPAPPPGYGTHGNVPSWSVADFRLIADWVSADPARVEALSAPRPELLAQIFGPMNEVWVGGSRRDRHEVWRADAEGVPVWLLASKRGTVIEFEHVGNQWNGSIPQRDVEKVLRFVVRLYERLADVRTSARSFRTRKG
jgi:hypothetical protein